MADNSRKPADRKPRKPYPDFPLTPHSNGQFCKKIRGKICYFGGDPAESLKLYELQRDDLYAGRTPRRSANDLTVEDLCNLYLESKRQLMDSGRLKMRTWRGYKQQCERVGRVLGNLVAEHLTPADFDRLYVDIAKTSKSLKGLDSSVNVCKLPFTWAYEHGGLLSQPLKFGSNFTRGSRHELRKDKATRRTKTGKMMYEREEIHLLLSVSPIHIRAMVWLGINAGFGNADVGSLRIDDIDFKTGWVHLPRSKSGEDRRCRLWPQTLHAVRQAIAARPEPSCEEYADRVFLTVKGNPWHDDVSGIPSPLSQVFKRNIDDNGLTRRGRCFYALRHSFETIAINAGISQVVIDTIMGHADDKMSAEYREYVADSLLVSCTDTLRDWLFIAPQTQVA